MMYDLFWYLMIGHMAGMGSNPEGWLQRFQNAAWWHSTLPGNFAALLLQPLVLLLCQQDFGRQKCVNSARPPDCRLQQNWELNPWPIGTWTFFTQKLPRDTQQLIKSQQKKGPLMPQKSAIGLWELKKTTRPAVRCRQTSLVSNTHATECKALSPS